MAQYVKLRGNLTETEVQKYSAQILSGLDYLHKNDIIHRDIKGLIFNMNFGYRFTIWDRLSRIVRL